MLHSEGSSVGQGSISGWQLKASAAHGKQSTRAQLPAWPFASQKVPLCAQLSLMVWYPGSFTLLPGQEVPAHSAAGAPGPAVKVAATGGAEELRGE